MNEATSEKAKALMKAKLDEVEEVIRKIKRAEKPSFIFGVQRRSLAPQRSPVFFDTQCQNSYEVTFDKSNKTLYNG